VIVTTIQTALTAGMPTLAVLVGILVNNSTLSDLSRDIDARFTAERQITDARFESARQDLLQVEGVLDAQFESLDARLERLERADK
jgi:hypothetical protein